tara:strand:- start:661 stop:777 length:117 start_codon:yes stop_codon:yes gene_type:complete
VATSERWHRVKNLFADALEQPTDVRHAWLASVTDDEAL